MSSSKPLSSENSLLKVDEPVSNKHVKFTPDTRAGSPTHKFSRTRAINPKIIDIKQEKSRWTFRGVKEHQIIMITALGILIIAIIGDRTGLWRGIKQWITLRLEKLSNHYQQAESTNHIEKFDETVITLQKI